MRRLPGARSISAGLLATGLFLGRPWGLAAQDPLAAQPSAGAVAARSLIVPGWGQHQLEQRRGLVYALAEATLWTFWAQRRHAGNSQRVAYKDLAWDEARVQVAPRTDPQWAYYETLSKWRRSGAFDGDPGSVGIQPEEDPGTFNGSTWHLAVGLYFPQGSTPDPESPAYAAALDWYGVHAYGETFLWDWSGKDGEQMEYKNLIHDSDHSFSQATAAMGAVLANHLLSATDAFVSARLPGDAHLRVLAPIPGSVPGTGIVLTWRPAR